MRRHLAFLCVAVLAVAFVAHIWAQPPTGRPTGRSTSGFQGYWMGVDPVDGGDARRSLIQQANGKYSLAARDSVLTLCDGTDQGFGSFDDGEVVGRDVLRSNNLILQCFNNGASVVLNTRFELIDNGLMIETATRADGTPVSTIAFHKVSQD
jgi:hypothetical protein